MNPLTILIVEDSPWDRRLLRAQLEAEGHAVIEAGDGMEAMVLLERAPVDAVISDILMPQRDGFWLCHEVRCSTRLRDLPFVLHTATFTDPSHRRLGREVGADAYLLKPTAASVLLEALEDARKKSAGRRVPCQPQARAAARPSRRKVLHEHPCC